MLSDIENALSEEILKKNPELGNLFDKKFFFTII